MKNEGILLKYFKNMKGKWTLLLLGILGVTLLLFGGGVLSEGQKEQTDSEDYRTALCAEVTALCREVRGVGEVTVLLTLEAGESYSYAENASGGYIAAGGGGLLLESRPPRVAGVAVVCDGGGDPAVREELSSLLSAALGIGRHKVKITAKK